MSRNGVERKKPRGLVTIERRQDVVVRVMGIPLAAFSMMALRAVW